MAERDGLRHLQVGETWHHGVGVRFGKVDQRPLQIADQYQAIVDGRAQVEADVGGHLVVARATRVQALAGVADQLGQALLDVEVHVLEVDRPDEAPGLDVGTDLSEPAFDVGQILGRDHPDGTKHACMRERPLDIEARQPAVEADRCRKAFDALVHGFGETAGPGAGGGGGLRGFGPLLRIHR